MIFAKYVKLMSFLACSNCLLFKHPKCKKKIDFPIEMWYIRLTLEYHYRRYYTAAVGIMM